MAQLVPDKMICNFYTFLRLRKLLHRFRIDRILFFVFTA